MNGRTCQFCGKPLWRLRLGGEGDFCSREHRNQYQLRRGLSTILEADKAASLRRRQEQPQLAVLQRPAGGPSLDARRFFVWRDSSAWREQGIALPRLRARLQTKVAGATVRRLPVTAALGRCTLRAGTPPPAPRRGNVTAGYRPRPRSIVCGNLGAAAGNVAAMPARAVPGPAAQARCAAAPPAQPVPGTTQLRIAGLRALSGIAASNTLAPAALEPQPHEGWRRPLDAALLAPPLRGPILPAPRLPSAASGLPSAQYALMPYDMAAPSVGRPPFESAAHSWLGADFQYAGLEERWLAVETAGNLQAPQEPRQIRLPEAQRGHITRMWRRMRSTAQIPALIAPQPAMRSGLTDYGFFPLRGLSCTLLSTRAMGTAVAMTASVNPAGDRHADWRGQSDLAGASALAPATAIAADSHPRPYPEFAAPHTPFETLRATGHATAGFIPGTGGIPLPPLPRSTTPVPLVAASPFQTADLFISPPEIPLRGDMEEFLNPANCGAVRIEEHFNSGLERWTGGTNDWRVDVAGVRVGGLALFEPSLTLRDYEMEFLAQMDGHALCWVFRATGLADYYSATLRSGELQCAATIGGVAAEPAILPAAVKLRPRSTVAVRMRVSGADFHFNVDGTDLPGWRDSRLAAGGIGFQAGSDNRTRLYWVKLSGIPADISMDPQPVARVESKLI
jgi:hypothetical protein